MSMLALLLLLLATATVSASDFVFENEVIKLDEIFDLDYARESDVSIYNDVNTTSYYCVFRSHWTAENHPAQYPELARWGDPIMFSHTKQYAPFLKNLAAPNGVEQIAEVRNVPRTFFHEMSNFLSNPFHVCCKLHRNVYRMFSCKKSMALVSLLVI
jgi:Spondin_N